MLTAAVFAATLLAPAFAPIASAKLGRTVLVSRATGENRAAGNDYSYWPSISADGRIVAFMSEASNLHPADRERGMDVYVRDVEGNRTILVSRASGPTGRKGNSESDSPSISSDGRYVAFASDARNLHPDAPHGGIFVRDLRANTTTPVARASPSPEGVSPLVLWPSISPDGRKVAYVSLDPVPGDPEARVASVLVHDLQAKTTTVASRGPGPGGALFLGGHQYFPSLSADGRLVAFTPPTPDPNPYPSAEVFVNDFQTGATTLVSRASGANGTSGNGLSFGPSISADGRFVAFDSKASNLDPNGPRGGVFVRELEAGTTTLVSRASGPVGANGNGESFAPSISGDGRLVTFASYATNLRPQDRGRGGDIYVRDLQTNTTTLVTRGLSPRAGDDPAYEPYRSAISTNGRVVAFASDAANLHPDDRDTDADIFVRRLGAPPLKEAPQPLCRGRAATFVLTPLATPVRGTPGADVIFGSNRADIIRGGGGNDVICGRGGDDRLSGESGRDSLDGGSGDDHLRGGRRDDLLVGGPGNDHLDGRAGRDTIQAGAGNDLVPTAGIFADRVDCGPGRDRVIADPLDRLSRCER